MLHLTFNYFIEDVYATFTKYHKVTGEDWEAYAGIKDFTRRTIKRAW